MSEEIENNFSELLSDFDLFADEGDQLADDYLAAKDSEYTPFVVDESKKTHNPDHLTPEQEYYTFIELQNTKGLQIANMLSLRENARYLFKTIRDINDNKIDFRNVVVETYLNAYDYNSGVKEQGKNVTLDIDVLSNVFSKIAKNYQLFESTGNEEYLIELGKASKLVSFAPEYKNVFYNNLRIVKDNLDVLKPKIRELIVDDCHIPPLRFVELLKPDNNIFNKSFDEFSQILKSSSSDSIYVERRLDDARAVFDMVNWTAKKSGIKFGPLLHIVTSDSALNRKRDVIIQKIINSNVRWLYSLVNNRMKSVPNPNQRLRDALCLEAKAGYSEGVNKFNVHFGYRVNTYASSYAELYLRNYNIGNQDIVHIPISVKKQLYKLNNYRDGYYEKYGFKPTDMEAAKDLSLKLETIRELDFAFTNLNVSSLDSVLGDDGGATVIDMVDDGSLTVDWDGIEENVKQREFIEARMCLLSEIERHALKFTDPLTDPYGENLSMDYIATCSSILESNILPKDVDNFILNKKGKEALSGLEPNYISPEKLELISDIAKDNLSKLSHFDTVTIDHLSIIKEFISGHGQQTQIATIDIATNLKINLDSIQNLIGISAKFGVSINVSDLSQCIDNVDDEIVQDILAGNNKELISIGIKQDLNSFEPGDIGIKTVALRSEKNYKILGVDVLAARFETMSALNAAAAVTKDLINKATLEDNSIPNNEKGIGE
ncbi:MAG: hypothetical protein QM504_06745 [Pseudomonadota bacterium]